MLTIIENVLYYLYTYAWFILLILLVASAFLFIIIGIINKYRIVKKERIKQSKLLEMSYEDEKSKFVGIRHNVDEITPKNKKYCPVCHALVNKRAKICPVCKNQFKTLR